MFLKVKNAITVIMLDIYSHVLLDMHKEVNNKLDNVFFK